MRSARSWVSASASGLMAGFAASAKRAMTAASSGSVFALSPSAWAKPELRRIDDGDGEARSRQSRSDNGFEPARGLQGDGDRVEGGEFGAEAVQAFRVAFNRKSFTRGPKHHIELIL